MFDFILKENVQAAAAAAAPLRQEVQSVWEGVGEEKRSNSCPSGWKQFPGFGEKYFRLSSLQSRWLKRRWRRGGGVARKVGLTSWITGCVAISPS